jgi:tetratricopeptide (TPR) repeat protein
VPSPEERFVGRQAELAKLTALVEQAVAGCGCIVFASGDAGIGKSAFVAEVIRRARQAHPLILVRGRCVERYGSGEAYLPFLDALGSLLVGKGREATAGLLRTYAPTWCLQLPAAATSPEEQAALRERTVGATQERMLRELGDVFEAAAANAPLVGLLEDLQWADPSTLDLLRHVGNRIERQRILILVTYRPAAVETGSPHVKACIREMRAQSASHEIALPPLSPAQIAEYLEARFAPDRVPEELGALVHRKTEGHPLFVTKLVEFLEERGRLVRQDGSWVLTGAMSEMDVETPESLREVIRRRVEMLGEDDRRALQHASVIGREFSAMSLAGLLEQDELTLDERLVELARAHQLIEAVGEEDLPDGSVTTRYRFANSLCQEVLYQDLTGKRRTLLHRQVGEDLARRYGAEAPRLAAQLAQHYERGRDLATAGLYLMHAGDNDARCYAYREARESYSRGLRLIERLSEPRQRETELRLFQKRALACLAMSDFGEAVADFRRMRETAAAMGRPDLECEALGGLCQALFFSRRMEEMAIHANEALAAAARAGSESLRVEALAVVALIVIEDGGNLAEARPLLDEVIATSRRLGHAPALMAGLAYRAAVHYFQTENEPAEKLAAEALGLASGQRDGFHVLLCVHFLGLALFELGRLSEARATLTQGIEMARRNGERFWLGYLLSHLGLVHLELQDFDVATTYDEEALKIARESGSAGAEIGALINLVRGHVAAGRRDRALEVFEATKDLSEKTAWLGWNTGMRLMEATSVFRLLCDDLAGAQEAAEQLLAEATRHEADIRAVSAHRLLAEVALSRQDPGRAIAHLEQARELLRDRVAPLNAWRIQATLGRARAARGEAAAARQAYAEAEGIVRRLAENVMDEDLRDRFMRSPTIQEIQDGSAGRNPAGEQPGTPRDA